MVSTKDSGQRDQWQTGAQRDTQDGKPQFGLISLITLILDQHHAGGPLVNVQDFIDQTEEPITGELPVMDGWMTHPHYRPDLIPDLPLNRLAHLYGRGAEKYDDDNWKRGIPLDRVYESLLRHAIQWANGDTSEDHMAAVAWNAFTIIWTENAIANGELPEELATKGPLDERPQ